MATTTFACPACCTALACASLEFRKRGGLATLCGYDEYATPSTPPKRYRKQTASGQTLDCSWAAAGCTTPSATNNPKSVALSGSYVYDQYTCAETNGQIYRYYDNGVTPGTCGSPGTDVGGGTLRRAPINIDTVGPYGFAHDWQIFSPTRRYGLQYGCFEYFGSYITSTTSIELNLSEEDSNNDALLRLFLSTSWGGWGGIPWAAAYEIRTSGFSFNYIDVEVRSVRGGLVPGQDYTMDVKYYRRPYGVGAYTLYMTVTLSATADGSGVATFTDTVPNDPGTETYAACA